MSYTLAYKGAEIDDILGRAAPGGALDTAIAAKQNALTFDAVPTEGSTNPAESGGIYDAIQAGGAAALAAFATDSVSGDVVSFPDGADDIPVKSFVGSIIPQQNLNGQASPYPAGGGANKWDEQWELGSLNWATGTPTASSDFIRSKNFIPVTPGATYYLIAPTTGMVLYGYDSNQANGQRLNNYSVANLPASITIPDGVYYLKWRSSANTTTYPNDVAINYPSTVTTYSPYTNICPISGWTGAKIWRSARNLVCGRISGYTINASGILSPAQGGTYDIVYAKVEQGEQYIVTSGSGLVGGFFREVPAASAQSYNQSRLDTGTLTVTAPIDGWLAFRVATGYETPQVDVGSTATAYDDTLDTILLDFGQTVYAGTLTALGGGLWKIQPTHAALTLNGSESWAAYASGNGYRMTVSGMSSGEAQTGWADWLATIPNLTSLGIEFGRNDTRIYAAQANTIPSVTDLASWQAYLGTHPLTILYPLATLPAPITITGEDLQTLLGANTVWTDVGSVTGMTYRADTALYIQKLIGGGGTLSTLSMASPSPSLSLGRVGVLAEPEEAEPEQTDEEAEQLEQTEEPEQTEEE